MSEPLNTPAVSIEEETKKKVPLQDQFAGVAEFLKKDKGRKPATVVTSVLLGTTGLTPLGLGIGAGITGALATVVGASIAPIISSAIALGAGLYLLTKTGDMLIKTAGAIGKKAGIPETTLGIALGVFTSLPETVVTAGAVMSGNPAIGIGNIVGSNIANILLILGAAGLISKGGPLKSKGMSWKFNAAVMGAATLAFGAQMALGALNPIAGCLMLGGLFAYGIRAVQLANKDKAKEDADIAAGISQPSVQTAENENKKTKTKTRKRPKKDGDAEEEAAYEKMPVWANLGMAAAGLAGLIFSAGFTVAAAVALGTALGVSPIVVGVLAVAVGTSLPELVVSMKAAMQGKGDIAIGNILGSNIFNILMIGGGLAASALVTGATGIPIPPDLNPTATAMGFLNTAALGLSAAFCAGALAINKGKLGKVFGAVSLAAYAAYTVAVTTLGGGGGTPAPAAQPPATVSP